MIPDEEICSRCGKHLDECMCVLAEIFDLPNEDYQYPPEWTNFISEVSDAEG